jgi:PPK2 family polyphosphate:nucleotide phosphotransferase
MIQLANISTRAPEGLEKKATKEETAKLLEEFDALQYLLYAENKHSVLVILQGMDASGKDGAIKNVFGTLNPQGVRVHSFKVPTQRELSQDFLWRVHQHAPPKGMIQIFNRSQYEEVLISRVKGWCNDECAQRRFEAINDFEKLLQQHNTTSIFKFYLHISYEEQHERLMERLEDPRKHWKYNKGDFEERALWDQYMLMYEDIFRHCNHVPWTIVPADQNWVKEYTIAKTVVEHLRTLDMKFPQLPKEG